MWLQPACFDDYFFSCPLPPLGIGRRFKLHAYSTDCDSALVAGMPWYPLHLLVPHHTNPLGTLPNNNPLMLGLKCL